LKFLIIGKEAIVGRRYSFLYKALHGIIDIDAEPYIDFYKETIHLETMLTLKMRYARTNVLKDTFFIEL